MVLFVPPIAQQHSNDCLFTCLKMVLGYYGMSLTPKQFSSLTGERGKGPRFNLDAGLCAAALGLQTDCFAYNHCCTYPGDAKLSQSELPRVLEERLATESRTSHRRTLESIARTVRSGAVYHLEPPSLSRIRSYIRKGVPVIASISRCALYKTRGNPYEGHDIVITGTSGGSFSFVDPMFPAEQWVDGATMLFSILARKVIALPSYMVAIKPKSPSLVVRPLAGP